MEANGESTRVHGLPGTVGGRPFSSAKLYLRCTGPPFGNFQNVFPVPWLKELVLSIQAIL